MANTFQCSPNEEITSVDQFNTLVSYSDDPVLADTAMSPRRLDLAVFGWLLVGAACALLLEQSRIGWGEREAGLSDRLRERRGSASGCG